MHHFMFHPDWNEGCPSCASAADGIGKLSQLHARDTTLVEVSRAPIEKLAVFGDRMGWTFPWYSSNGSDFNYDFFATVDDRVAPPMVHFRTQAELKEAGVPWAADLNGEWPGSLGAIAECHERAAERVAVDPAANLDDAAGAEELDRAGHNHVGPAALGSALGNVRGELVVPLQRRCVVLAWRGTAWARAWARRMRASSVIRGVEARCGAPSAPSTSTSTSTPMPRSWHQRSAARLSMPSAFNAISWDSPCGARS